jgi:hypothetical protein
MAEPKPTPRSTKKPPANSKGSPKPSNPRKPSKPPKPFYFFRSLQIGLLLLVLGFLGVGAIALFTDLLGQNLLSRILVQTEKTLDASGLLISMGPRDELLLAENIHKVVFPFDYIHPDANLQALARRLQSDRTGRGPEEILSPVEWQSFEAFNLARATGFDPSTPGTPFLVITKIYEFGYSLDHPTKSPEPEFNVNQNTLLINQPSLLRIRIEDPRRDRYPYPDVRLSPINWQRISDFVVQQAELNPDLYRAKTVAEQQARQFFQSLLQAGGRPEIQVQIR